jgi:hypothetical protein
MCKETHFGLGFPPAQILLAIEELEVHPPIAHASLLREVILGNSLATP